MAARRASIAATFEQSVTWTGLPRQLNPPKKHSRRKSWISQPLDEDFNSERPSTSHSIISAASTNASSTWVREDAEDHHTKSVAHSLSRSGTRVHRGHYEGPMAEWTTVCDGVPEGQEQLQNVSIEVPLFQVCDAVFLQGLVSEDTWNGAEGTVEAFDVGSSRYRVRLGDGRVKEVYGENLELKDCRWPATAQSRPATAQSTISGQRPSTSQSVCTVSTRATTPSGADWPRKRTTAQEAAAARPATALVLQSLQPPALIRPNVLRANRRMQIARLSPRSYQEEDYGDATTAEAVRPTSASQSLFRSAHNSFARANGLRQIPG